MLVWSLNTDLRQTNLKVTAISLSLAQSDGAEDFEDHYADWSTWDHVPSQEWRYHIKGYTRRQ
jgi:hypothetical protein